MVNVFNCPRCKRPCFFYASVAQKCLGLSNYYNRLFEKNTNSFFKARPKRRTIDEFNSDEFNCFNFIRC